jgi:hypothetical protein
MDVAVDQFDPSAAAGDVVIQGPGDHDGSMPAAGASYSDVELVLAFFLV